MGQPNEAPVLSTIATSVPLAGRAAAGGAQATGRRFMLVLTIVSLMIPATFSIGSLTMTPSRAVLLVLTPILFLSLLGGRFGKLTHVDVLVILYIFWRSLTPFINNPKMALEYVGSNSVIFFGGYLVARAAVRDADDFRFFAKALGSLVILTFPFALYESITGRMVIPPLLDRIPGITSVADVNYPRRLGLDRAQVVFVHPIHYGIFCSLALSIYFMALKGVVSSFRRWAGSALIFVCAFLSISSGAFLASVVQIFLVIYGYLFRRVERRWLLFGVGLTLFYTVIELGSNRNGLVALLSILSFSASTAYGRLTIFDAGMAQIVQTPIFGAGFVRLNLPSWMTGSLDNFWLGLAVIFGIPAFLFLFGAVLAALIGIGRRRFEVDGALANIRLGWSVMLISVTLSLATVYIWSEIASMVMLAIGSGVFLLNAQEAATGAEPAAQTAPAPRRLSYSRFAPERERRPQQPERQGRRPAQGPQVAEPPQRGRARKPS